MYLLQIILIVAKIFGFIEAPWLLVLLPLWLVIGFFAIVYYIGNRDHRGFLD